MRYLKPTLLAFVALLPFMGHSQSCGYNFLGTKTLYSAPSGKPSAAPAGYQPVFINHVGRHGARHLTKEVSTSFAWKLVMHADSVKGLTSQGRKLKQLLIALDKVEHGQVKSISAEGKDELQGIGKRMATNYPQVFSGNVKLNTAITKEVRTKQSADAFLAGLRSVLKDNADVKEHNDDTDLRFYDSSPAYLAYEEHGDWETAMIRLKEKLTLSAVYSRVTADIFTTGFYKTIKPANMETFVNDIFGFATIVPSLKEEIKKAGLRPSDVDFDPMFNCNQLIALSRIDVAEDYLKKGPGMDANGIQVKIAVPLLVNFINTTDHYLKDGTMNAELRFAHAETISPFATLLGISNASKVAPDIEDLGSAWWSSEVIPLSANIQWVFYRKSGSDDILVKVLLNEREAKINGLAGRGHFYDWKTMRNFYMAKLEKMHVGLNDDMVKFLKEVK